jgi:hypothetical protein
MDATYVSSATFTVLGNCALRQNEDDRWINDFPKGRRCLFYLESSQVEASVNAAIYQEDVDNTLVSIDDTILDDTLTEVHPGPGYYDEEAQSTNLFPNWILPWTMFNDADENTAIKTLASLIVEGSGILTVKDGVITAINPAALEFIRKNAAGTAFEAIALTLSLFSELVITDPVDGQVLAYNSEGKIVNRTISTGSSGGDAWTTYYQSVYV